MKSSKKEKTGKTHTSADQELKHNAYFTTTRNGAMRRYSVKHGYGYFVPSFQNALNRAAVQEAIGDYGIPYQQVSQIIEYLGFNKPDIALAASVSQSTVSRWNRDKSTSIGLLGSANFFRIDELIKKGIYLFGGPVEFKEWLSINNIALGGVKPISLLTNPFGIDQVEEALDALDSGAVL